MLDDMYGNRGCGEFVVLGDGKESANGDGGKVFYRDSMKFLPR